MNNIRKKYLKACVYQIETRTVVNIIYKLLLLFQFELVEVEVGEYDPGAGEFLLKM